MATLAAPFDHDEPARQERFFAGLALFMARVIVALQERLWPELERVTGQQLGARGAAGLAPQKPGRKPKLDDKDRALLAAQKKVAALEHKLHVAEAIIDLQKKAHALLGIALPDPDEAS